MERYSGRTVDEIGRIVVHSELRKKLSLTEGDKFSLTLIGTIIILQRVEENLASEVPVCEISELGLITLPCNMRDELDLKVGSKVSVYNTDSLIILKKSEYQD